MLLYRTVLLSILVFVYLLNLTAQDTPLEVYVHDSYTDHPLESALVSVLLNGVVIDSAYTSINGIATLSGVTSVREPVGLPTSITLSHNYPNPFSDDTNVEIGIPEAQTITATVYNILGQRVASEQLPVAGGYYTLNLSLGHLPTGVYFLRIDGRESQAIKLLKMGRGFHPTGPVFSISGSSFLGGATIGKSTGDEYTVRAVKDRYDVYEAVLEQPLRSGVIVPLARNNIVEFVVVDGENNLVAKQLEIKIHDYQTTITTPQTLTLKSGVYRAVGEVEQGILVERTVEIPSVDTTVVLTYEEVGVKLEGAPDAPAIGATYDLNIPIVYPEEAISVDPDLLNGGQVLRTEIEVITNPDASIAEVNSLLDKYNAQIVSMLQENTIFIIRVPDPGDVTSLNQLVGAIEDEPIVLLVNKSVIVEDQEPLYDSYRQGEIQQIPAHTTSMERIDHHLAARAHAAWNLRDAITEIKTRPWIVIADYFGDGPPGAGYNANFLNIDFATGNVRSHGYHVLGIISGMYDRVSTLGSHANDVTGIFPERLNVYAVDLAGTGVNTWPRRMNEIISTIGHILSDDSKARVIVNTSLNSRDLNDQAPHALSWIIRVRGMHFLFLEGLGLENRFVHFTSTGNNRVVDGNIVSWAARDNSMFAYAALEDMTLLNFNIPKLTNTFVVENRVNTPHQDTGELRQRPVPGCASNRSIMGGTLSAMGTDVWSFGGCTWVVENVCLVWSSDPFASNLSGTSMATPQAAGVAAYVWAVNPNLSVSDVMNIIKRTAITDKTTLTSGFACHTETPQPVIDLYAAVLAAGGIDARRILLDVSGDGVFDHHDIQIFVDTLKADTLDYSRFDLNGDGIRGGGGTERFDLNMDGQYLNVSQMIEDENISFDERNVTDIEILCYYAYSDLYEGDEIKRRELLDGLCMDADIDGNVYKTVKIGSQIWMAENLRTTRYRNGDLISNIIDESEWSTTKTGAWVYFDNDTAYGEIYGKLYNWFAVNDERGLCPEGWHVPSFDEWEILSDYLGGWFEAGGKMKATGTQYWLPPNEGATNESGWTGLPGNTRDQYGRYYPDNNGASGSWWSSTEGSSVHYARAFWLAYTRIWLHRYSCFKVEGLSVRCVKD